MRPRRGLGAVVLAAAMLNGSLDACVKRNASATPEVIVEQMTHSSWRVLVPGWTTVATPMGSYCGLGLAVPASGVITGVGNAVLLRAATRTGLFQVVWDANAAVAAELNALQAGSWSGFLGSTPQTALPADVPATYCFRVAVKPNTTFAQLESALKSSWVGSDAADSAGKLQNQNRSVFRITKVSEGRAARNFRLFHNADSSNVSTRFSAAAETLYFMQPGEFRRGWSGAAGWRGVFQDQDASTAESLTLGYVKYASGVTGPPDVGATGTFGTATFQAFGNGSGNQALELTLTAATMIGIDSVIGLSIELPAAPNWPKDGVSVHAQDGPTTKLPLADRDQWTFRKNGSTAAAFRAVGSTFHLGGLYDASTQQIVAWSTAYGPLRMLQGPESLRPDGTNGDRVGFLLRSEHNMAPDLGIAVLAQVFTPGPIPTQYGSVLVGPNFLQIFIPYDAQGVGTSIRFPGIPGAKFKAQTFAFSVTKLALVLSDAAGVDVR